MRLKNLINQTIEQHSNSIDFLKKFELKDEDLTQASVQVNHGLENLNNERDELMKKIFIGSMLKFVENATEKKKCLIGAFEDDESQLVHQKQLNRLKSYQLKHILYDSEIEAYDFYDSLSVQVLNNGNICIAYTRGNEIKC